MTPYLKFALSVLLSVVFFLVLVLLTGCEPQMKDSEWNRAMQMCAPFGGVYGADADWRSSEGVSITAYCRSGHAIRRTYKKDELK